MQKNQRKGLAALGLFLTCFAGMGLERSAFGDEGMWTLNGFPTAEVAKKYGFQATQPWLDHVRLSSARLAGGCSGSFVSDRGLVMTNHHCAHSCIEQLSNASRDYVETGFFAKTQTDEVKCPEIEVNRLLEITDVTAKINQATEGLDGQAFNDAQKGAMSKVEKECSKGADDVRCEVVTLYHGGKFNLYRYRRFQDVRLVFAPELSIAFFGGDPDNFTFPRYDLDVSFLRVYSDGNPIQSNDYFKWSTQPAKEGDLTFVTGHPGHTSRTLTVADLKFERDVSLVQAIFYASEMRGILTEFSARGSEQKRIAGDLLFGIENRLKALKGKLSALQDQSFFDRKTKAENDLRKKVNANAKLKKAYASAWGEIEKAELRARELFFPYVQLERSRDFQSQLFRIARTLVRASVELPKANEIRFREFTDSKLPELKQRLFSEAPIYNDLEETMFRFALTKARELLTMNSPAVKAIFGKRSPEEIARDTVKNTRLKDVAFRKALFEGGQKAIDDSTDPMIQFAKLVDTEARPVRKRYEDEVEAIEKKNNELVAKAAFAIYGDKTYPDATFTLRISYGQIKGYSENGTFVKPVTTMGGAYDRHTGRDPFALPESWLKAKTAVEMATPLDFCSTNDIIGGNSGSPVVNSAAEIVGLIFDGNIQSLGGDYGFDETVNRAVAVHSSALIEALSHIYGADRIVREIKRN
ncbi:S46 family peptidase [Bdellovibrionota bacterium FG-1]